MKLIFAVKDQATEQYGMPFCMHTKGEAMRSFTDEVNRKDGNSQVALHPEDYELWHIGDYEEETGIITQDVHLNVERLARAKDLIKPEN